MIEKRSRWGGVALALAYAVFRSCACVVAVRGLLNYKNIGDFQS